MHRSAAPYLTYLEGVLQDGLVGLGIGLKLRRVRGYLLLLASRQA